MYKLTFTVKQPEMEKTLELEKLEDIFQPSEKYENVERFSLADVFDNVDYGINILKPTKDEKDFVIIYATETFWDYFSPNLHEYLIGRLFNQTLSQFVNNFDSFNNFSSVQYKKNRMDGILKLYENNKLIKVWSQINISQGELLYCCMQDQTDYYLTKEKEKNIFEHSAFPILDINRKCQIITSNKSFKDLFDFSKEELNEIGLDNIVTTFNTEDSNVSSFADAINQIFDEKLKYNDSEIGIITKENEYKWVKAHIRLISNELVRISFQDLSELKRSKNHALNLNKYLSGIEEASKTAFYIKDDEGYHWTDEIFNILEIDSNRVYLTDENFLYEYMNPQDINKIKEAVKNCTLDNPVNMDFEVITAKGNKEFLRIFFRLRKDNKQLCQLGFIQNITEQRIAQKEAIELKENIEGIQEVSKIFISSFGDGEYNFTDEIYNILNINRTNYAPNQILDFIDSKDQEKLFYHFNNVSPENPDFHLTYKITSPANGETKYITCYNKANFSENGDLIKIIGFQQDVTEEAIIKIEALHLRDNFALIQGLSKMFIAEYDGENYYFTSEAYNILELNPNEYSDNINIVKESVIPEDEHIWKRFNTLNPEDSHYQLTFRVKTGKGNIRYLYVQNMATFDENGKFQKIIGFLQDVTEERLITNEALNLQESLDSVGDFAKIALASYENGEYTWTDEFYNILKINPQKIMIKLKTY